MTILARINLSLTGNRFGRGESDNYTSESLGLVFAHDNWNDGPAFEGQQGNTVNPFERHQPLVVRDASVFPEARANGFVPAIGFADMSDTTDGHLSGDSEVIVDDSGSYQVVWADRRLPFVGAS